MEMVLILHLPVLWELGIASSSPERSLSLKSLLSVLPGWSLLGTFQEVYW